jgi:hypothetical protein
MMAEAATVSVVDGEELEQFCISTIRITENMNIPKDAAVLFAK